MKFAKHQPESDVMFQPVEMVDLKSRTGTSVQGHDRLGPGKRALTAAMIGILATTGLAVQAAEKPLPGTATVNTEVMPEMTNQYRLNQALNTLAGDIDTVWQHTPVDQRRQDTSQDVTGKVTSYSSGVTIKAPLDSSIAEALQPSDPSKLNGVYDLRIDYAAGKDGGPGRVQGVSVYVAAQQPQVLAYAGLYNSLMYQDPQKPGTWQVYADTEHMYAPKQHDTQFSLSYDPLQSGSPSIDSIDPYIDQARSIIAAAGRGDTVVPLG